MLYKDYLEIKNRKNKDVQYLKVDEKVWDKDKTHKDIEEEFYNLNKPLVLRGFFNKTIAARHWNKENISDIFPDIVVPCEVYNNHYHFYNGTKSQRSVKNTMKNCVEYIKSDKLPHLYMAEVELDDVKHFNKKNEDIVENRKADLFNPNISKKLYSLQNGSTIYLGKDASSGCHVHVEENFILNQIFGEKTIYFFDYHDNDHMITSSTSLVCSYNNFIRENFFELDHSKMKIYKTTLKPGDSVMIPPWWWHATRGNGLNCSNTNIYIRRDLRYLFFKPLLFWLFILKYFALDEEKYELTLLHFIEIIAFIILLIIFVNL